MQNSAAAARAQPATLALRHVGIGTCRENVACLHRDRVITRASVES